jgi:hypothetical protein
MGLLDDAIREHLELKRRQGADPSEVARQQRAVLDTDPDDDSAAEPHAEELPDGPLDEPVPVHEGQLLLGDDSEAPPRDAGADSAMAPPDTPAGEADLVQETVELDMRRELAKDDEHAHSEYATGE